MQEVALSCAGPNAGDARKGLQNDADAVRGIGHRPIKPPKEQETNSDRRAVSRQRVDDAGEATA